MPRPRGIAWSGRWSDRQLLHYDDVPRIWGSNDRRSATIIKVSWRNKHERSVAGTGVGGKIFFAFISAIAFATILAVVAGLTISATTSFAHDFWTNVIHRGVQRKPGEEVRVARISAFVIGAIAIAIAIFLGPTANVAFLVALAFAVAASANLPVIVLSIFWRRFNTAGAVSGLAVGLISSIGLILVESQSDGNDPPTVTGAARHLIQAKRGFRWRIREF